MDWHIAVMLTAHTVIVTGLALALLWV